MDAIRIDQFTMLALENYKGTFSLVEGFENKAGEFKPRWIKEEFGKNKEEKLMPKRVKIGDINQARAALQMILKELGENPHAEIPESEIPF